MSGGRSGRQRHKHNDLYDNEIGSALGRAQGLLSYLFI
jgi:hypothetical protein